MPGFDLRSGLMLVIPLILSLSVHEFAHAWTAWRLGDDTAARMGRLTLNPLVHIDLVGTVLLPMLSIPFGWARPTPFDPSRFRRGVNMRTGAALVSAAGPISNLLLAVVMAAAFALLGRYAPSVMLPGRGLGELVGIMVYLNVNLAIFNLIPVPPLDGSKIVDWFVPQSLRPAWERVMLFSPFLLLAVFFFAGRLVAGPSQYVMGLLYRLVAALGA